MASAIDLSDFASSSTEEKIELLFKFFDVDDDGWLVSASAYMLGQDLWETFSAHVKLCRAPQSSKPCSRQLIQLKRAISVTV